MLAEDIECRRGVGQAWPSAPRRAAFIGIRKFHNTGSAKRWLIRPARGGVWREAQRLK